MTKTAGRFNPTPPRGVSTGIHGERLLATARMISTNFPTNTTMTAKRMRKLSH